FRGSNPRASAAHRPSPCCPGRGPAPPAVRGEVLTRQCSVARIATASGPSRWSLTGVGAAMPPPAAGAAASSDPGSLPVLSAASIPLLGRGIHVAVHVHSMDETAAKTAAMTADNAHNAHSHGFGAWEQDGRRSTYCLIRLRLPCSAVPAYPARRPSGV